MSNNFDTIREALEPLLYYDSVRIALTALTQIEADHFTSADMASAAAQGHRDGVASVTAGQEPVGIVEDPYYDTPGIDWHVPLPQLEGVKLYAAPVAQQQESVAWMHWLHGPVRVFGNKDEAVLELERLNREYPADSGARQMRPLVFGDAAPVAQQPQCWCTTCRPQTVSDMRFVVCPDCGNKRCPRAHNHALACTGSNEPGQPGSSWEHVKPAQQPQAEAVPPDVVRDAERYRQVRRGQKWSVIDGIGDDLRGDALDASIDAAMAQGAKT